MNDVYYCHGCTRWVYTPVCEHCGGAAVEPSETAEGWCCSRAVWGDHTPQCQIENAAAGLEAAAAHVQVILVGIDIPDDVRRESLDHIQRVLVKFGDLVAEQALRYGGKR